VLEILPGDLQLLRIGCAVVHGLQARDVRQQAGAVQALPPEQAVREGITRLPLQLGRHEAFQTTAGQDLGQ